jgi:hypothetical protein
MKNELINKLIEFLEREPVFKQISKNTWTDTTDYYTSYQNIEDLVRKNYYLLESKDFDILLDKMKIHIDKIIDDLHKLVKFYDENRDKKETKKRSELSHKLTCLRFLYFFIIDFKGINEKNISEHYEPKDKTKLDEPLAPGIPEKIKIRHSLLLMYEFGVIKHLETELKNRGVNLAQENRNYLPNLLSVLMNISDKGNQETIRKEISQHLQIIPPLNSLNAILANFGLEIKELI